MLLTQYAADSALRDKLRLQSSRNATPRASLALGTSIRQPLGAPIVPPGTEVRPAASLDPQASLDAPEGGSPQRISQATLAALASTHRLLQTPHAVADRRPRRNSDTEAVVASATPANHSPSRRGSVARPGSAAGPSSPNKKRRRRRASIAGEGAGAVKKAFAKLSSDIEDLDQEMGLAVKNVTRARVAIHTLTQLLDSLEEEARPLEGVLPSPGPPPGAS